MAKAMPSPQQAAQNWQTGFSNSGQKWAAGINAVTTAPGVLAAAAKPAYLQGVQANVDKWAANVSAVDAASWKQTSISKGQTRLASGAQVGMAKYQAKIGPVLQAIGSIRDSLPARGPKPNVQRMVEFATQLHQRAQQGF